MISSTSGLKARPLLHVDPRPFQFAVGHGAVQMENEKSNRNCLTIFSSRFNVPLALSHLGIFGWAVSIVIPFFIGGSGRRRGQQIVFSIFCPCPSSRKLRSSLRRIACRPFLFRIKFRKSTLLGFPDWFFVPCAHYYGQTYANRMYTPVRQQVHVTCFNFSVTLFLIPGGASCRPNCCLWSNGSVSWGVTSRVLRHAKFQKF